MTDVTSFLERHRERADLAFRVLFSLIFVTAGIKHVTSPEQITARLLSTPMGSVIGELLPAEGLVWATGAALLVGGMGLLLGFRARLAAALLAATLIPITLSVQTAPGASGPFFKNVALLGGAHPLRLHGRRRARPRRPPTFPRRSRGAVNRRDLGGAQRTMTRMG